MIGMADAADAQDAGTEREKRKRPIFIQLFRLISMRFVLCS